jgi:uncharacterized protein YecT (DUF1311 family)
MIHLTAITKTIFIILLLIRTEITFAKDIDKDLNYYINKSETIFIYDGISNFGNLRLIVEQEGIKKEETIRPIRTLYGSEDNFKIGEKVIMKYSNDKGFTIQTLDMTNSIIISGGFDELHPFDIASSTCLRSAKVGFADLANCTLLSDKAWDSELNRAYMALGGSANIELRTMQRTWIKYKENTEKFLAKRYLADDGWSGKLNYLNSYQAITKEQCLKLWDYYEW